MERSLDTVEQVQEGDIKERELKGFKHGCLSWPAACAC
jgi:hypothetical protein